MKFLDHENLEPYGNIMGQAFISWNATHGHGWWNKQLFYQLGTIIMVDFSHTTI